jgi:hypothetical protein
MLKSSVKHFVKVVWQHIVHKHVVLSAGRSTDVRIVNFATSKNLVVKSIRILHRNIRKYTWAFPDGKTHSQTDHKLIDRRWHLSILDARSFRGADCDTDCYLIVAKVR